MAITIKKRASTVKTIKSKAKLGDADTPKSAEAEAIPVAIAQQQQVGGKARVDGHKYTYAVVFAILAILMFIGLIALQGLELSFYYQPRPVFLRKVSVTSMPSAMNSSGSVTHAPAPSSDSE